MFIVRRLIFLATVVIYGCLALSPAPVLAARHRHHESDAHHHAHEERTTHRDEASVRLESRHHRHSDEDRIAEADARRGHRRRAREIAEEAREHAEHLHEIALRQQREVIEAEIRTYGSVRRAKLHFQRVAEEEAEERLREAEERYRLHLAEAEKYHQERVAEMNGDISSKSIRAWSDYVLNVPIRLISVDLNDPTIKVNALLAQNGIGSAEPFSEMIKRSQPDVAVTGTFFSLDNLHPVGDIVINGDLAYFGGMGTALAITPQNHADMITVPWGHHHDWSGYNFVMACGPRLLSNAQIVLDPAVERFHDRHMLSPNSRIGVGITPGNKLVFVMTKQPIYLGRLAKIMRAIGCTQAMNLDAGTSTGFYCDGNMMARPGRWLTNAIVVYANQHSSQSSS